MRRLLCLTTASIMALAPSAFAQGVDPDEAPLLPSCNAVDDEVIVVTGAARPQSRTRAADAMAMAPPPSPSIARPLTPPPYEQVEDTSRFDNGDPNPVKRALTTPLSTFSADVDTASYAVARRYLRDCEMPPSESIRVEEFINAFDYGYALPSSAEEPFNPDVEVFPSPWNENTDLIRIGIEGYDLVPDELPSANIVLLLDVSGSMNSPDKLPLLIDAMELLIGELDEDDRVSIVVYAGAAGVVLEPTPGDQRQTILHALRQLRAGGSTAGGEGLALAYDLAQQNFDPDGVNRIILATDGDFNVGVTGDDPLTDFVARKREQGIYLSILGFGRGNLNDQLMQTLAQNGNGVAAYIDSIGEAERILVREFRSSIFPIAEDVKFQVEFNPASIAEYRLIGYQTRLLSDEDFDNDQVDAGEVGSGHSVTALYEVVSRGEKGWLPELRYDSGEAPRADRRAELAYLKIRYKLPGADESQLIERPIEPSDRARSFRRADADSRFAALVSAFAEKLARSDYVSDELTFEEIADRAEDVIGDDPYGDRALFVALVRRAAELEERAQEGTDAAEDDGE